LCLGTNGRVVFESVQLPDNKIGFRSGQFVTFVGNPNTSAMVHTSVPFEANESNRKSLLLKQDIMVKFCFHFVLFILSWEEVFRVFVFSLRGEVTYSF